MLNAKHGFDKLEKIPVIRASFLEMPVFRANLTAWNECCTEEVLNEC